MINMTNENVRRQILENGTIRIMEEEGLIELLKYYREMCNDSFITKYNPSRKIKLPDLKKPIDEEMLDSDRIKLSCLTGIELKKKTVDLINEKGIGKFISEMPQYYSGVSEREIMEFLSISNDRLFELFRETNGSVLFKQVYPQNSFAYKILSESEAIGDRVGKTYQLPYGKDTDKNGEKYNRDVTEHRIYINTPNGKNRYEFLYLYRKKCIEKGIPFEMKGEEHSDIEQKHLDRTILYVYEDDLTETLSILEEIKQEKPELISTFGSPIPTGLDCGYYSVCHGGTKYVTYNDWFNKISSKAINCYVANLILNDTEFLQTLSEDEKIEVMKLSKITEHSITPLQNNGTITLELPSKTTMKYLQSNFSKITSNENIQGLNDIISKMASLSNFGDLEHSNLPVCLSSKYYDDMDVKVEEKPKETELSEEEMFLYHTEQLFNIALQKYMESELPAYKKAEEYVERISFIESQFRKYARQSVGFAGSERHRHVHEFLQSAMIFKQFEPDPTKGNYINMVNSQAYYSEIARKLDSFGQPTDSIKTPFDDSGEAKVR